MEYQNVELVHVHSCPVCKKQGWEFAHSLSLLCSKSLILKSELFSLLLKKERCEWFTRDSSESIAKNGQSAKKIVFFVCFSNRSRRSSLSRSFVKITLSDLLPSLFTKQQWEIHSSRSWQKSDGAIRSFSQANRSSALLLTKNEQISRKTDEWIPYPSKKMVCPHCPKNKLDPRIKNKIVTRWGGCNQTLTVASAGVFMRIFILLGQCCGQTVQGFNWVLQWLVVAHAWFMRIFILLGQCCGQQCKANCVLQWLVVVAHAVFKAQIPHYCTLIQGFDVFTFQVSTFRLTIWALNWIISNNWF